MLDPRYCGELCCIGCFVVWLVRTVAAWHVQNTERQLPAMP